MKKKNQFRKKRSGLRGGCTSVIAAAAVVVVVILIVVVIGIMIMAGPY